MSRKPHILLALLFALGHGLSQAQAAEEKILHIYNWSDYIAEDTIANFGEGDRHRGGVRWTATSCWRPSCSRAIPASDLVVPSSDFLGRQLQAGVFQKLDKSKLPNLVNLDPATMTLLQEKDPDNGHAVPYLGGTTGIAITLKGGGHHGAGLCHEQLGGGIQSAEPGQTQSVRSRLELPHRYL